MYQILLCDLGHPEKDQIGLEMSLRIIKHCQDWKSSEMGLPSSFPAGSEAGGTVCTTFLYNLSDKHTSTP